MKRRVANAGGAMIVVCSVALAGAGAAAGQPGEPPASSSAQPGAVSFDKEVRPILDARCMGCHGAAKRRGSLRLDSLEAALRGGKTGPAIVPGKSAESLLIKLVKGEDPDRVMPDEDPRLTEKEIATLAAWIDQGAAWGTVVAKPSHPYQLKLRRVDLSEEGASNLVDVLIDRYFGENHVSPAGGIDDRAFARRAYLDVVGLLPEPAEMERFLDSASSDKRAELVDRLLADNQGYAEHWLSFWNDALRNDYQGTGYIDGGREQITQWLYAALYANMPFDRFARELVAPTSKESEGFSKGIVWRGVVNASQVPAMQAAQNVSQVFLGLNLKCASCHDSFINDWKLADAYSMAAAFSDGPLEVSRCDQPQGTMASARFLYPETGSVDASASRVDRQAQLAAALVARDDGRFSRTIVNRIWQRLTGRGIIEPADEMDNDPWCADLLEYLAGDLVDHGYDLKRTMRLILTSRFYAMATSPGAEKFESGALCTGPVVRRMTAEQFVDAVRLLAGVWQEKPDANLGVKDAEKAHSGRVRAAMVVADPLMMALGRPNREQVVTVRQGVATTLQAIELTNGAVLDGVLKAGAARLAADHGKDPSGLARGVYLAALGREPTKAEAEVAASMLGEQATAENVQDFLWMMVMLPEFQLIR